MANIVQVIIGDEVLSGKIQDLNLKWLATHLLPSSFNLIRSEIVKDDATHIKRSLKNALNDSDIVIVTGGLGPTKDDITKQVLCEFTDSELLENLDAKNQVIKSYEKFGKTWNPKLNDYHLIPTNVTPMYNPKGLAPGLHAKINDKHIFCAPGVPLEFQAMMEEVISPKINEIFPSIEGKIRMLNIRTFGIPEEKIFGEICPGLWEKLETYGSVSSLPHLINVDITLRIKDDENTEKKISEIKEIMSKTPIAENIWHYGLEEIPELVVKEATQKGLTISFAESCTGGLVSSQITDISGSSTPFLGSVVSYANSVKENIVNVKAQTLNDYGAVSLETAMEMAQGINKETESDISVSLTGIAGPGGGTESKPVGTVAIGYSFKNKNYAKIYNFKGDRLKLKERFAKRALYDLLMIIRNEF